MKEKKRRAPGAGRPKFEDEAMGKHTITLTPSQWAKATKIGGNASAGIRKALDAYIPKKGNTK